MTRRSDLEHRKREVQAAAMAKIANKALSRRTTGLDLVAKKLLAKRIGVVTDDPELEHPAS